MEAKTVIIRKENMMTHSLILDSLGEPYNFSPNHQNKKSEEGLENGLQMKFCHLTADSWQRSGHLQFVFASFKVSSQGPENDSRSLNLPEVRD